jgi:hypothetical protein
LVTRASPPSTQIAEQQHDALERAGCERVCVDHASGALDERPHLARALDHRASGGTRWSCGALSDDHPQGDETAREDLVNRPVVTANQRRQNPPKR